MTPNAWRNGLLIGGAIWWFFITLILAALQESDVRFAGVLIAGIVTCGILISALRPRGDNE